MGRIVFFACLVLAAVGIRAAERKELRVYSHRLNPASNVYARVAHAKPVGEDLFEGRYDYVSVKGADTWSSSRVNRLVDDLDCGRIVHPVIGSLFSSGREQSLSNLVSMIKAKDLVLFGPWWQVPAWGRQVHPRKEQYDFLENELGNRWLGMENGEQDARYLRAFAPAQWPQGGKDRFESYLSFNRFFDRLSAWMGDRLTLFSVTTLVPHLLREGTYTCLGMETSQMHPNAQVSYAFVRGAGKQYGVPWYGDVSLYGRWGWKNNRRSQDEPKDFHSGREDMGTSYSLMKRLAYSQYFYNCLFGSMEGIQFDENDELYGSGIILKDVRRMRDEYGDPGVLYTPVAIMTDVFAGWNVPRLTRDESRNFTVWGTIPYNIGDYLTLGVFDILYPGFEAGHYFADERGYLVGTPFGDIADAVLSDAPACLLKQYAVVVLAGEITPREEMRDVLREYLSSGGHLVLTEGNRGLLPENASGRITVIPGTQWGVVENPRFTPTTYDRARPRWNWEYDRMASARYVLTDEAIAALNQVFDEVCAFTATDVPGDSALSVQACYRGRGEWIVTVLNNRWKSVPFRLNYRRGTIVGQEELKTVGLDSSVVGYLPEGLTAPELGCDTDCMIAGGSVRVFRVQTNPATISELPQSYVDERVENVTLSLYGIRSLREEILRRPSWARHFSGVKVDARYMLEMSAFAAREESRWLKVRGIPVIVDLTDIVDRFAGIRLTREDPVENARTDEMMDEIVTKMKIYGVKDAVVALHHVEVNSLSQQIRSDRLGDYTKDARRFVREIEKAGCSVHLRMARYHVASDFEQMDWWTDALGVRPTFSLAQALALTRTPLSQGQKPLDEMSVRERARKHANDLWLVAAPGFDGNNDREISLTEPVGTALDQIRPYLDFAIKNGIRIVLDANYDNLDCEYADVRILELIKKDEQK